MPTRIACWIAALALGGAATLMPAEDSAVPMRDILTLMVAWIVLGEAACRAMRMIAPAPLPPAWSRANGVVLTAAMTLVLLFALGELRRDPGPAGVAFSALLLALAWFACDLLTLGLWRLSRASRPPVLTLGRFALLAMVACSLALVVLEFGWGVDGRELRPLYYGLAGLPLVLVLGTVFFDYPAALDRRKHNQDVEFHDLVANAPPPPVARVMPGARRR